MSARAAVACWLPLLFACSEWAWGPVQSSPDAGPAKAAVVLSASSTSAVSYVLRFTEPEVHTIEVEGVFPTEGKSNLLLAMAVWTPGSYLVREYAKNIDSIEAFGADGQPRVVSKVRKNRFNVALAPGDGRVMARYHLYAREPSVRTNFVDSEHAVVNGAATFLFEPGAQVAYRLAIEPPKAWPKIATSLAPDLAAGPGHYQAESFDQLVDSPILLGDLDEKSFQVDGVPVHMAHIGGSDFFDTERAAHDMQRVVEETGALFGGLPYERYLFLSVFNEAGGGLEHGASTLLMSSRLVGRTREGYLRWLYVAAHEHFHAWNGKRLRPIELGPFDYENETYTEGLWLVEGFTSYYDDLIVARAGKATQADFIDAMFATYQTVEQTPGRAVQTLARASFDAWIKLYRPDENTANSAISYYDKGALLAFVLDASIREESKGHASLDDVMREAYRRWSGATGYKSQQIFELVGAVGGPASRALLERGVNSTDDLDARPALRYYGLRFKPGPTPTKDESDEARHERRRKQTYLGVETSQRDGRWMVVRVVRGAPAYTDGIEADDELIAVDDLRINETGLDKRLELYEPGDQVVMTIARRGRLRKLPIVLGERPVLQTGLELDPARGPREREHLAALLKSSLTRR